MTNFQKTFFLSSYVYYTDFKSFVELITIGYWYHQNYPWKRNTNAAKILVDLTCCIDTIFFHIFRMVFGNC